MSSSRSPLAQAPAAEPLIAENTIVAYRIPGWSRYPEIVPAPPDREWMDAGTKGWANR
jgi:hypothetical protein